MTTTMTDLERQNLIETMRRAYLDGDNGTLRRCRELLTADIEAEEERDRAPGDFADDAAGDPSITQGFAH